MSSAVVAETINSVPVPEILYLTEVFDKALSLPETVSVRKHLCDAIREVMIEYIARSSVSMFLEDNVKYTPPELLANQKSA